MNRAQLLEGWKPIAVRLSEQSGFDISPDVARKLAQRARDPLPVRRWGRRVAADPRALDEWTARQAGGAR